MGLVKRVLGNVVVELIQRQLEHNKTLQTLFGHQLWSEP